MTNCHRLKLEAADGKKYLTDVANAETLLRLIQSIPSPKAEPIKLWLAKVGFIAIDSWQFSVYLSHPLQGRSGMNKRHSKICNYSLRRMNLGSNCKIQGFSLKFLKIKI